MTKRLQVLLPDEEMDEVRRAARRRHTSVAGWVREALRKARASDSDADTRRKLEAIERAAGYSFPTADIDQMLSEIELGYRE